MLDAFATALNDPINILPYIVDLCDTTVARIGTHVPLASGSQPPPCSRKRNLSHF